MPHLSLMNLWILKTDTKRWLIVYPSNTQRRTSGGAGTSVNRRLLNWFFICWFSFLHLSSNGNVFEPKFFPVLMCACWQGWVMGENIVLSGFHLKQGQSAVYLGVWMRGEEGRRYNCSSHLVTVCAVASTRLYSSHITSSLYSEEMKPRKGCHLALAPIVCASICAGIWTPVPEFEAMLLYHMDLPTFFSSEGLEFSSLWVDYRRIIPLSHFSKRKKYIHIKLPAAFLQ